MARRDIIVIGGSAGGIEVIKEIVSGLPADLPAAVFVVVHISPSSPSVLPHILARHCALRVKAAEDGETPVYGTVYVASSNHHLFLKPDLVQLGRGPRENGCRPSVDALFRTAAFSYGERVIGVIVSGALNDGTAGLMTIKYHGGLTIVQSPSEATFSGMPASALEFVDVDNVAGVKDIAELLVQAVNLEAVGESMTVKPNEEVQTAIYEIGNAGLRKGMDGKHSSLTCPSCGGALWESEDAAFKKFKCHVGHSYTAETLLQEQSDSIDIAFWRNLRQLEENILLRQKLADWDHRKNHGKEAAAEAEQLSLAKRQAEQIRRALLSDVARLSDPEPAPLVRPVLKQDVL